MKKITKNQAVILYMNSFFALLFRQKYITRWGLMRSVEPESLSEHTAECAVIAHALALIGNTYFGKSYDPDESVLTLYAAWVPYYTFEIYAEDQTTLLATVCARYLTIPELQSAEEIVYDNFPEREGYVLKGVYYLDSGVKVEGSYADESATKRTITGEWDEETATLKTPVIKLYTEWEKNTDSTEDNVDSASIAQSLTADDDGPDAIVTSTEG
jgi:hypothetical protein